MWVAILIQALVFGIMHMNMIQGTYAFFLGLVLGVVYYKYKSIWAPIILHFTFNMTSTLLSQFATEAQMESMLVGMLVVGLIGSAFMGFVLYRQYVAEDYPEVIEVEASAQVVDNTDVLIEETVSESL